MGVLTSEELAAFDSRPVSRSTPEYSLWLGNARYVLYLRVQVFEKTSKGRWRTIDGLKPFRVHFRHDCALLRLLMRARRIYGMRNDVWKLTGREFDDDRAVCLFAASGLRPRKIKCTVLERTRALTKKQGQHLAALINRAIRSMARLLMAGSMQIHSSHMFRPSKTESPKRRERFSLSSKALPNFRELAIICGTERRVR